MKNYCLKSLYALFGTAMLLFSVHGSAYGQSIWMQEYTGNQSRIGLEAMLPSIDDPATDAPTSAWYLFGQFPLSDNMSLQVDLPVSHYSTEEDFGDLSETDIGNPYIGIKLQESESVDLDFGIRLPLAADDGVGLLTGILIENYRIGAFAPETFSVVGALHYRYANDSGLIIRVGGGPEYISQKDVDGELFLEYYGQLMYGTGDVTFGGGLVSRMIITQEDLNLEERSLSSFGLSATYEGDGFRPGLYLQLPLDDDINDALDFIIGLNLSFGF